MFPVSVLVSLTTMCKRNSDIDHIHIHVHTMLEPASASWGLGISDAGFKKLSAGFKPQDMMTSGVSK